MSSVGSLRVELELKDGSFTTRVIRAGTTLKQLEAQVGGTVVAVRRLDTVMASLGERVRNVVLTLGLARAAVENLHSVFGAWAVNIIKINAELERSEVLLRGLSNAATEAGRAAEAARGVQDLLTLASQSPFGLTGLQDAFVKLRAAGIEPTRDALVSLVDAVAAAGGTEEQLKRAAIAMQQMAGKGVISMEELRQQLGEAVPRAVELMARSMNMSIGSLVDKVSRGQVEAKGALASLAAEFERTFGGAAIERMDTFDGKLAQLDVAWKRFALEFGRNAENGGFFQSVKDAIDELIDGLGSNQAAVFARELNETLEGLVEGFVSVTRTMIAWREEIAIAGRALLVFFAITRGYAALVGLLTALRAVTLAFAALPGRIAAATTALSAFRVAAAGAAAPAAVGAIAQMASSLTSLGGAALGAFNRMSMFGRLMFTFSSVGLVIGGLSLLAQALEWIGITADRSAEAIERLKMGANDDETVRRASERAAALARDIDKLTKAEKGYDELVKARAQSTFSAPGVGDLETSSLTIYGGVRRGLSTFEQSRDRITAELERLRRERAQLMADIEGANSAREDQRAEVIAQRRIAAVRRESRSVIAAYDQMFKEIQERRNQFEREDKTTDSDRILALNAEAMEKRAQFYRDMIAIAERALNEETEKQRQALERRDELEASHRGRSIERLNEYIADIRRRQEAANLEGNPAMLTGANQRQIDEAERRIAFMKARIEELRAEITRGNPELAKAQTLLAELAKMQGLPDRTKQSFIEVATELGEVEQAAKLARREMVLMRQIDSGLDRARADVERYTAALTDPTLPEAQRNFITFERQMIAVLRELGTVLDVESEKFKEAADRINEAVRLARTAANLSTVESYLSGADSARARAAERGPERAAIQRRLAEQARDRALEANLQAVLDGGVNKAKEILGAFHDYIAAIEADSSRALASAGARLESHLTRLQGRLADLADEVQGGAGEWAKLNAQLSDAQKATAAGQQILMLARQVDDMTKHVEAARSAWSALEEVQRSGAQAQFRFAEYFAQLQDPGASEDSRQIIAMRARTSMALQELQRLGVAESVLADQRRSNEEAITRLTAEYAARQALAHRDKERQIRQAMAGTLEERRALALQELQFEEQQGLRLIELAKVHADERAELERNLQNYIAARREQALRETEGPLARFFRQTESYAHQLENVFVSAFDRMGDALAEFVATGKLDFNSLANAIIADLIRMQIRAAASGLFGMLGNLIGPLFGGGLSATGYTAGIRGGFGMLVGGVHEGGIAGREATFWREVPEALFAGAQRFHTGGWLRDDEVPAILQRGEAVFTAEQLAAIGRLNHSYELVEAAVVRIATALARMPEEAVPSVGVAPVASGGPGARGGVTVNLINQSGQQLEANAAPPRFDFEGMVVDVVIRNAQRPGALRDTLKAVV
jgi:lambda family phage tail tape measure protein